MKIAVWHNLPSGGGKRALYDQVKGLVARGHRVEAWCPDTANRSFLPLAGIIEENCFPTGLPHPDGPRRGKIAAIRGTLALRRALSDHARQCSRQISAGGFDVLLAHPCRFFHSPHIGRFATIPSVLYLQEPNRGLYEWVPRLPWPAPLPGEPWSMRLKDSLKIHLLRRMVREEVLNARAFGRVLCNSYFSAESIARAYGLEAQVCYLGVDGDLFQPAVPPRERSGLISVGAFIPAKDPEVIIRAVAALPALRPRLSWIANHVEIPFRDRMMTLAQALGVDLELRHLASDAELVAALQSAALAVYAPRLEPFGYAPLEANACGTPAVGVRAGGVRETIKDGETGILVDRDAQSLGDALRMLLQDEQLRNRLGETARAAVLARWTTRAAVDRLVRQLEIVAGRR